MCDFSKCSCEKNQECNVCARIKKKLISVLAITYQGLKVEFVKSGYLVKSIQNHYKVITEGIKVGGLNKLDVTVKDHQALLSTTMSTE
jgi:hypothetical protein